MGDGRALGRYARARRADNLIMGVALNALWQLFSDQRTLVGRLRRTGLGLVNRASPLKQLLTGRALGA